MPTTTPRLRPILAAAITIIALLAPALAQAEGVTIATYNVENFFDRFDNPFTNDEQTEIKRLDDIRRLAATVRAVDADLIGFQELENEQVLDAFNRQHLAGMGYDHVVCLPSNDGRGITLGFLSRLPVLGATTHRWEHIPHRGSEDTHRFARDLLRVTVAVPGGRTLEVFNVHFKSKGSRSGDPQSVGWRSAEAVRSRAIVNRLLADNPEALIAFLGDFNSEPTDPAAQAFFDPAGEGTPLIDLLADRPADQRFTYVFGNFPPAVFDYIAASPALAEYVVPRSVRVMPKTAAARGSDHLPVVATFDIPPAPAQR
ncbi:MAG: endonuclease/exonuclease/phosphatase family protein [Planctomycetota bacterium]